MISESTRAQVWDSVLEISRVSRYFNALHRRYRLWGLTLRTLLAVSGIGAIASLVDLVPNSAVLAQVVAIAVAVVVVLELLVDPRPTEARLSVTCRDMERFELAIQRLWRGLADASDDGAVLQESAEILRGAHEAAHDIDVPTHKRLNERCADEAYRAEAQRYGA